MSPTPPGIDAQLSGAPSPPILGSGDDPTPPQSEISAASAAGKRLGAKNVVRPPAGTVKASGKAGGKRVEAPEVAPRPPEVAPVAGRRQSKPTPAKVALAEAAASKKKKKAEAALPKAAAASSTRKASTANPPRGRPPRAAVVNVDEPEVFDGSSASVVEEEVATFMSQLEGSHAAGIDDMNFDDQDVELTEQGEVEEEEVEEEVVETQGSTKKSRASNYSEKEDVTLCYAWMNVSLDASVATDQSKDRFWARIEEYYNNNVEVPITRTQGSLGHRWGAILESCNRWSGCVDQVHTNPPSGVPLTEFGPLIQDLYKMRNKKNGGLHLRRRG